MVDVKEIDMELEDYHIGSRGQGKGQWKHVGFDALGGKKGNPLEINGAKLFMEARRLGGTSKPKELLYKALYDYVKANQKPEETE